MAVEFALVAPILFVVIFAVIDFSRAFYTLNDLTAAVREGARYAATLDDPAARVAEVKEVVKNFAMTFGQETVDDAQIEVNFINPDRVEVIIREFEFEFLTPLPALVGLGDIEITRGAVMKWERAPRP